MSRIALAAVALLVALLVPSARALGAGGPELKTAPKITGTAQQGRTLKTNAGEWTPEPGVRDDQWLRCASTCAEIPGATGTTYVPVSADIGKGLAFRETVAVSEGEPTSVETSVETAVVTEAKNSAPPSIKGTLQVGQSLEVVDGKWTPEPPVRSFQWLGCQESTCTQISGATGPTYVLKTEDAGKQIEVEETADYAGSTSKPSPSSMVGPVLPEPPVAKQPPTITGTAQQGQTLTEAHGEWSPAPTEYKYQWLRCSETGTECHQIASATAQTYKLGPEDVNHEIKVEETAEDAGGAGSPSTSAAYPSSGGVLSQGPASEAPPAINGTAQQGQTLTDVPGKWTNEPNAFKYEWLRCNGAGAECVPIAGAGQPTYVLTTEDIGHTIVLEEAAENAGGSAKQASAPTAVVTPTVTIVEQPPPSVTPPSTTTPPPVVVRVPVPLVSGLKTRLIHKTTLEVRFRLVVKARVRLVGRKGTKTVAHTTLQVLGPGMHKLLLKLNRRKWPNKIELQTHALVALPTVVQGG